MLTSDRLKNSVPTLSVGILTADMMNLGLELGLLEKAGVKLLHIDVMDGCIWPKITVGAAFVQGLKTSMLKDIHLLIKEPAEQIESFVKAGADMITFAVESCGDIGGTLRMIGQMENVNDPGRGILRGVSLDPATPLDVVRKIIDEVDIVLLLAVSPDSGRQNFISGLPERIVQLRSIIAQAKKPPLIFIDGAIKKNNIAEVVAAGADVIVTGSAVFDGKNAAGNLEYMLDILKA